MDTTPRRPFDTQAPPFDQDPPMAFPPGQPWVVVRAPTLFALPGHGHVRIAAIDVVTPVHDSVPDAVFAVVVRGVAEPLKVTSEALPREPIADPADPTSWQAARAAERARLREVHAQLLAALGVWQPSMPALTVRR